MKARKEAEEKARQTVGARRAGAENQKAADKARRAEAKLKEESLKREKELEEKVKAAEARALTEAQKQVRKEIEQGLGSRLPSRRRASRLSSAAETPCRVCTRSTAFEDRDPVSATAARWARASRTRIRTPQRPQRAPRGKGDRVLCRLGFGRRRSPHADPEAGCGFPGGQGGGDESDEASSSSDGIEMIGQGSLWTDELDPNSTIDDPSRLS